MRARTWVRVERAVVVVWPRWRRSGGVSLFCGDFHPVPRISHLAKGIERVWEVRMHRSGESLKEG